MRRVRITQERLNSREKKNIRTVGKHREIER
jgi:hypothetical protein